MANLHKHLFGCAFNKTTRACCIACKWDDWQNTKTFSSVIGKAFEQLLTPKDEAYLQAQLISWR